MGHFSCAFVSVWHDYTVFSVADVNWWWCCYCGGGCWRYRCVLFSLAAELDTCSLLCKCVPLCVLFCFFFLSFSFVCSSTKFILATLCENQSCVSLFFCCVYECAINFDFIAAYLLLFRAFYRWFYLLQSLVLLLAFAAVKLCTYTHILSVVPLILCNLLSAFCMLQIFYWSTTIRTKQHRNTHTHTSNASSFFDNPIQLSIAINLQRFTPTSHTHFTTVI